MSNKIIIGNWKMYPTLSDSLVLSASLKKNLELISGVDVVIAPPTAWLVSIIEHWQKPGAQTNFAAQNVWPEDQGAYTGEVSAYMVKDLVKYALVGHSERRSLAGEDNDLTHQKVQACLKWGIKPVLCVGESRKIINDDGKIDSHQWNKLVDQLIEGLSPAKAEDLGRITVAYEPVWAIGTKNPASDSYATQIITKLRLVLAEKYGEKYATQVKFLYGGSVDKNNAIEFLRHDEIDGILAGGVSVKANDFIEICRIAAKVKN